MAEVCDYTETKLPMFSVKFTFFVHSLLFIILVVLFNIYHYNSLQEGHRVTLNVYDLSQGLARQLSMSFLGKAIEGIW